MVGNVKKMLAEESYGNPALSSCACSWPVLIPPAASPHSSATTLRSPPSWAPASGQASGSHLKCRQGGNSRILHLPQSDVTSARGEDTAWAPHRRGRPTRPLRRAEPAGPAPCHPRPVPQAPEPCWAGAALTDAAAGPRVLAQLSQPPAGCSQPQLDEISPAEVTAVAHGRI